jgi:hypothetical protein
MCFYNLKDETNKIVYIFFDLKDAVTLAFEKNLLLERVRCYEGGRFSSMIIRHIDPQVKKDFKMSSDKFIL